MKITLFAENYYRGGVDTFIITLLNNWPEATDEFTFVCNDDHPGLVDIREKLRRPCRVMTYRIRRYAGLAASTRGSKLLDFLRRGIKPLATYLYLAHAVRELKQLICNGSADRLMIVNGGYPGGDICRAAGIAWGLYSGKPASIHNFHNLATPPGRLVRLQENAVDALLARHTRAFITVSQATAHSMATRPAISPAKVSHIYNGLEPCETVAADTDIRRELGISEDTPLCLMLGTYEPRKGHRFLLQVFRRVIDQIPTAHFVICGHGSDREISVVESVVAELGLGECVHILGFRGDAARIIMRSDLLLVGSQEFESFGLTCVEAMMQRIPVVATRVGGLPEVVADGEGGFIFEKDDVEGYARQVTALLLDENLRSEQGNKGFERYTRLFTAQRMAVEYAEAVRSE